MAAYIRNIMKERGCAKCGATVALECDHEGRVDKLLGVLDPHKWSLPGNGGAQAMWDEFCKNCVIVRPKLFPDSIVAKAMFRAAEIARGPDEPAIGWARAREVFRNPNLGRGPAKDVFGRRLKRTRTSSAEVSSPAGFEPDHEAFSSPQSSRGQALHGDRYIPVLEALGVDPHSTL